MYTKRGKVSAFTKRKRKPRHLKCSKYVRKKTRKITKQRGGDCPPFNRDYPHNPTDKQILFEKILGLTRDGNCRLPEGIEPDPGTNRITKYSPYNRDGLRAHHVNLYFLNKALELMGWSEMRLTNRNGVNLPEFREKKSGKTTKPNTNKEKA